MKLLTKIGFVLLALLALFFIIPLFIDGEYAVNKTVEIDRSKDDVFEYIKYLKNQDEYSVWAQKDPDIKKTYKGTDGEIGFVSAWDSDNEEVGKGEQEIIAIKEGERIDYELRFIEPFEAKDKAFMSTKAMGEAKTQVTWGFNGKMNYPMNIMMLFMDMEEMLGPDLKKGLENLKEVLETEVN